MLQNGNFWGYTATESDSPLTSLSPGRANPIGISYLYTAWDANTAIAEIQPMSGELISVAKIKTKKTSRIFNFDFYEAFKNSYLMKIPLKDFEETIGTPFRELEIFFKTMSELFSRPALGNTDNYYATQYVSEYIKSKGFDGIKFMSSLKRGGSNVVLFDTSRDENGNHVNYEFTGSALYRVKNVAVTSKKVLPR